ncbi:hypothetical protein NQ317_016842 [Molorchus minor]|uniref:Uncharacterized protein n=1 Tax=Molorchus minor TaxID=1323400 RepID=A0ABQ9JKX7_9CUCU|nr:hypothetical protein NQ317_016842 [Molorchus minor]
MCLILRKELLRAQNSKKKKIRRRWWTRLWIVRRNLYGASECLLKELAVKDPDSYQNHLRMNNQQFTELLRKETPFIQKQNTNMRETLHARLKLQIALQFLASVRNAIYEALQDYIKESAQYHYGMAKIQNDF